MPTPVPSSGEKMCSKNLNGLRCSLVTLLHEFLPFFKGYITEERPLSEIGVNQFPEEEVRITDPTQKTQM